MQMWIVSTVVIVSIVGLASAKDCGGDWRGYCDAKRAGADGKSCQITKPVRACLKEGEWTNTVATIDPKDRAVGCKPHGHGGQVITAIDQPTLAQFLKEAGLTKNVPNPSAECARWVAFETAAPLFTKAIEAACKSFDQQLGASTCKDVLTAAQDLVANLQS